MKMPLIAGLAPPAVGPLRPTLAVGQVLPVRLITPEDAQELLAISKTLVVETTLGIARLRPLPAEIAARPPSPTAPPSPGAVADTARTPAQAPAPQFFLEIVSLTPLKVRLIAQDSRERGPGHALAHPEAAETELELEWLSPRVPSGGKTDRPLPGSRATAGPGDLPGQKPGIKPAAELSSGQARSALRAAVQQALRQVLPRQGELREEWPRLLKLEQALPQVGMPAGQAVATRQTAPAARPLEHVLGQVAAQLLRQALADVPDAKALRSPGQQSPAPLAFEPELVPEDAVFEPRLPGRTDGKTPAAATAPTVSAPLWRALRALLSGGAPRTEPTVPAEALARAVETAETEPRLRLAPRPPNWPLAAGAMQALVRLAGNMPPTPAAMPRPSPGSAGIDTESTSPLTAPDTARLAAPMTDAPTPAADAEDTPLRLLRQLLALSGEPKVAPHEAAPGSPRTAAAPLEMPVFAEIMHSLDKLAARSQGQQLSQLHQSLQTPGVFSWELPVRDGTRLDLLSLRIEERDAGEASAQSAGKSYWSCQLQFDFPELGPIRAVVQWRDRRIDTRFFAESPGTVALLNQELGWLNAALTASGVAAEVHPCQQAPLAKTRSQQDLGRFDVSV